MSYANPGFEQTDTHPAVCISYNDAKAYINWLNNGLGFTPETGYRLPSEAEWEYAARAGDQTRGWTSRKDAEQSAFFRTKPKLVILNGTSEVGLRKPNNFGLYDMLGNAWEWTEDCWVGTLADIPVDGTWREKEGCDQHALRGGSWNDSLRHIRYASRSRTESVSHSQDVGFRIMRPLFETPPLASEATTANAE